MQHVKVAAVAAPGAIQRIDLQDQVYETVKARVLAGDLGPDARLPLQAIADELSVSRSPVHHALTRLVTQRLVDVDSRGYRVRPVTVKRIEEAHGVRRALELYAADQTVGRLSADQLVGLRALLERTIACVANLEFVDKHEYMLANKAFHEYLVDLAGNETLSDAYRGLSLHELMERVLFSGPTRTAGKSSEEHQAIVAAYEAGDLEEARAAIVANIETGLRIAVAMIDDSGGAL
jgi:DNA-binding GntR family transcriptional regulator